MRALHLFFRIVLIPLLLGALPLQGLAFVAFPVCTHCLQQSEQSAHRVPRQQLQAPSHQHPGAMHGQVCHDQGESHPANQTAGGCNQCGACAGCVAGTALATNSMPPLATNVPPSSQAVAYRPAFYYRLTRLPLDRPPFFPIPASA